MSPTKMSNSKDHDEKDADSNEMMLKTADTDSSVGSSLDDDEAPQRGNWGRQIDFLFSCIGYAVGLGNLWRFPYLCMRNGGGAFLIPYFTFLFLCGIPLYLMELILGQFSSRSPVSMWALSPLFKGLGIGMIVVSGMVCIYYNVILAWGLYYMFIAFTSFKTGILPWASCDNPWNTDACVTRTNQGSNVSMATGNWSALDNITMISTVMPATNVTGNGTKVSTTATTEFWERHVLDMSSGIEDLGAVRWQLLLCLLLAWIIVFLCLCKGVKSSGKVVYVTATAPYLMLLVLLVRGVTLPGAMKGIMYYLQPDFSRLLDFKVWVEACAQIFYSLGPAYGGLITMASYNKFNNNCYRDALVIPVINCATSFLAGFVVFSIVGFLADSTNLPVDKVITSGAGLAFIVYPEALSLLPMAPLWAVIFFAMLVIIGLDTQFGMFETMTSCFMDEFPKVLMGKKMLFTAMMCMIQFVLGIPLVTQGGIYIFTIMDWYSATFSLMTISAIECLVVAWRYGLSRLYHDIELMIGYQPCCWWKACWMVITPLLLIIVLVFTLFTFTVPSLDAYLFPGWAVGLGWIMALCSLAPIPIVMVVKIYGASGSFVQRITDLSAATDAWGPSAKEDRKGTRYDILDTEASTPALYAEKPLV